MARYFKWIIYYFLSCIDAPINLILSLLGLGGKCRLADAFLGVIILHGMRNALNMHDEDKANKQQEALKVIESVLKHGLNNTGE